MMHSKCYTQQLLQFVQITVIIGLLHSFYYFLFREINFFFFFVEIKHEISHIRLSVVPLNYIPKSCQCILTDGILRQIFRFTEKQNENTENSHITLFFTYTISLTVNISHLNGTFATTDELSLIHYFHPKFTVYNKLHPWRYIFYG